MVESDIPLTVFPNLYDLQDSFVEDLDSSLESPWNSSEHTEDAYAIAFSSIVRAYTGESEIRLQRDNQTISIRGEAIDPLGDAPSPDSITVGRNKSAARWTGIFTKSGAPSTSRLRLELLLDAERNVIVLRSRGAVPQDHLPYIAEQVHHNLSTSTARGSLDHFLSNERLSIVNPDSSKIVGCDLLDSLALHTTEEPQSWLDSIAIEYAKNISGDHPACISRITYRELDERANLVCGVISARLASSKQPLKTQPVIPVLLPQHMDLYVALLAILRSGCAFCPLQLDAPSERLQFILNDIDAPLVMTSRSMLQRIPQDLPIESILLEDIPTAPTEGGSTSRFRRAQPNEVAYIEYTSGSTGRPKGVPNSHSAVTQSLLAHGNVVPQYSRFLQFASPTFDVSIFEIFFTLYRKATLVVCDRSEMLQDLPLVLNKLAVDACELTPTVAGTLLKQRSNAPALRLIMTIGEMLTDSVVREFGSDEISGQPSMLLAMYGPTEAAIHCTYQSNFDHRFKPSIIGSPLSTASAFILPYSETADAGEVDLVALPIGHVGELAIGGHQLADGYLKRPDQTQAAFIASGRYGRIYRTGDLARLLPSGKLEVLGRIQGGQVKLRGQRIELGEIESVASKTPGCQGTVGMVIDNQLVLFALASNQSEMIRDRIMNTCQQHLSAFMVPSDVFMMDQFPHLPSGKVDRKGLETLCRDSAQDDATEQQETDALTRQLVQLISDCLGRKIGSKTALIANGLDSLQAIRVSSMLRKAGINCTVSDLLSVENISELRQKLDSSRVPSNLSQDIDSRLSDWRTATVPKSVQTELAGTAVDFFPCTPLQLSMLAETAKDPSAYWNTVVLSVNAPCDVQEIRTWLEELAERHEMLRTGFLSLDDDKAPYCQVLWKDSDIMQVNDDVKSDNGVNVRAVNTLRPLRVSIISPEKPVDTTRTEQTPSWHPSNQQLEARPGATYVVIELHHAIYDGFSIDILVAEFNTLITGGRLANRASFHEISKYFFDLRSKGEKIENEKALTFWRRYLLNFTPRPLPKFHGRTFTSEMKRPRRDIHEFPFCTSLSLLRSFSFRHGTSCQSLVQAAFAYVLSTYLSSSNAMDAEDVNDLDVCLATVTSGRELPIADIENIIGPCIATLPLRVNLRKARTVYDLIRMVHDGNRHLLAHSTVPLKELSSLANLSHGSSLSEVLFVWQESLHRRPRDSESHVEIVYSEDNLEFELVLEIEPDHANDLIKARFSYNPQRLPSRQVESLAMQIDLVMGIFQDNTNRSLEDVSKLFMQRALERDQATQVSLLSIENPVPNIPDLSVSLVEHLRRKAKDLPDVVAVSFCKDLREVSEEIEHLTYAQLDKRSDLLASHLLDSLRPVPDEELVAVVMEKSVSLYIAILGVLKTGRGYLPLTPSTPKDRIHAIMAQARVRTCVSTADISAALDLDLKCANVVFEDSVRDAVRADFTPPLSPRPVDEESLGYAIFTSGSTGQPKGVLVTQRNLHSNLHALSEKYPKIASTTSKTGRLLQACSQAFDVSVFEIFYAWYTGMTLVSASNDVLFADIEHAIRKLEITHLSLTPTVAALVRPDNVPSVRLLVTAGEAVTAQVKSRWSDRGLWTGYGPSETTNICTINPRTTAQHLANNVGPPFRNTSAFVMRPGSDDILPRGAVGELCFGGDQVFRGYLNLPEVNKEKLVDHPIWGKIYRSRDLGRLLYNGDILFEGRIEDGQVKVRGQRVELSEINSTILKCDFVEDCFTVVVASADQAASKVLVSFWTPKSTHSSKAIAGLSLESLLTYQDELHPQEWRLDMASRVEASLLTYMHPTLLVPLPSLPRTSQGKIDRRFLCTIAEDILSNFDVRPKFGLKSTSIANRGEDSKMQSVEEQAIATELAVLLQLAEGSVRRHDSFYSFGLDSISAISFGRRLRRKLKVLLTVSEILRHATIANLAALVVSKTKEHRETEDIKLVHSSMIDVDRLYGEDVKDAVRLQVLGPMYPDATQRQRISKIRPCLPIQEGLIAASFSGMNKTAYCNTTTLKLAQGADHAKLSEAWEQVVQRHEILRTCFVATDDNAYPFAQAVLESHEVQWKELKIEHSSRLQRITQRVAAEVFAALTHTLPPYMFILAHAPDTSYLIFACHHAVYDAVGMAIMLDEVEHICRGDLVATQALPYEPFLAEAFAAQTDKHTSFWKDHLRGFKPLTLDPSSPGCFSISEAPMDQTLGKIENYCESNGISLLALCQVAVAKMVSSLFDRTDICFGHVVSGRGVTIQHDLEYDVTRLAAPTFNTLPVRVQLAAPGSSKRRTNEQLLASIHQHNLEAAQHQLTSLKSITRSLQTAASGPGGGLFSVLLLLQQQVPALSSDLWTIVGESGDMNFPLLLELIPQKESDTLSCRLHYDIELIGELAQPIIYLFQTALESCIRYPSSAFDDFINISYHTHLIPRLRTRETDPLGTEHAHSSSHIATSGLTPSEVYVRALLAEFVKVDPERISTSTSIFQLGIDSLRAIRLVNWFRKEKGVDTSLSDVLQNARIKDLAKLIESSQGRRGGSDDSHRLVPTDSPRTEITYQQLSGSFACTPVQQGILAQFFSTNDLYVNAMIVVLETSMDSLTLTARLQNLAQKYPILRTGFEVAPSGESGSTWSMIVHPPNHLDVDATSEEDDFSDLEAWRKREAQKFCDAIDRPPWSVRWTSNQVDGIQQIRLAMLHSLFDAHTLRLLLADLVDSRPAQSASSFLSACQFVNGEAQPTDNFVVAERQVFWKKSLNESATGRFPNLCPLREPRSSMQTISRTFGHCETIDLRCRSEGVTVMSSGQVAWARVLSIYTGESTVIFGTVLSGREAPATQDAMFPCIVTVPTSVNCSGSRLDMTRSLMDFNAKARPHQYTPLTQISSWRSTKFDTLFAYQDMRGQPASHYRIMEESSTAEFAVSVELEITQDAQLQVRLVFRPDILPTNQAELLIKQYYNLLQDAAPKSPGNRAAIPAIDDHLMSVVHPEQDTLSSPVTLLHNFVELTASSKPEKIALQFVDGIDDNIVSDRTWTYDQLNRLGNRVACLIQQHNVRPGSKVAICFDKCPEAFWGILGVLKSGCSYVAIDPAAPGARKEFIVKDCGAKLILTAQRQKAIFEMPADPSTGEGMEVAGIPLIYIDETKLEDFCEDNITTSITPDDLCYCLYTSGSTGTPKCCLITHRNAVAVMRAFSLHFENHWDEGSRWMQFASFHFDVSVLEQYWTWAEGLRVVCTPRDVIFQDLPGTLAKLEITHIDLTPSLALLVHPDEVPSLCRGVFITGGEALRQEILDAWGPHEVIYNGYGPTEATIGITMYRRVPKNGKPSNIGKCYPNAGAFVLEPNENQLVLRGGVGELCVFGELVGQGYLNRPGLNASKFPFVEELGQRIYRTGDLVRLLYDGNFDFLGRIDGQVKLRGQRLEVGEINAVILSASEDIQDIATTVLKHAVQKKDHLVSFVCFEKTAARSTKPRIITKDRSILTSVRNAAEACRAKLPPYMIPSQIIPISHLPLTVNNKLDTRSLQALYDNMSVVDLQRISNQEGDDAAQMTSMEQRIIAAIRSLSNDDHTIINRQTSVFDLGFDSISIIKLAQQFNREGIARVQPAIILQNPVIKHLGAALGASSESDQMEREVLAARQKTLLFQRRHQAEAYSHLKIPRDSDAIEAVAPCIPLQSGIIARLIAGNSAAYLATFEMELGNKVDVARLQHAWNTVHNESQILRTIFVATDDGYMQVILRDPELPWTERTTINVHKERDSIRREFIAQGSGILEQPFQLVFCQRSEERFLYINLCHALYDGYSLALILSRLRKVYMGESLIRQPNYLDLLPYGPLRTASGAKSFWEKSVQAHESFIAEGNNGRSSTHATRLRSTITIPPALEQARKRLGTTYQSIFQACWSAALAKRLHGLVTFGIVIAGRSIAHSDASLTIGPLFNTIPFQILVNEGDSVRNVVQECHKFNIASQAFQHTPLSNIVKWTHSHSDRGIFDNLFVYQEHEKDGQRSDNDGLWVVNDLDDGLSDYPLAFEVERQPESLSLTLVHQVEHISETEANALVERFGNALVSLQSQADQSLEACLGSFTTIQTLEKDGVTNGDAKLSLHLTDGHAPSTEENKVLHAISAISSIALSDIDPTQSIFELGLDSIDVLKLSSRLKKMKLLVSSSQIMKNPRIKDIASISQRNTDSGSLSSTGASLESDRSRYRRLCRELVAHFTPDKELIESILPATPLQEGMLLGMYQSHFEQYYNHDVLKLNGDVSVDKLHSAIKTIIARHAIYRTIFAEVDVPDLECNFAQKVLRPSAASINWSEKCIGGLEHLRDLLAQISDDARKTSSSSTLLRFTHVTQSEATFLVLSMPHAMYDGWSLALFHQAIAQCYNDIPFQTHVSSEQVLQGIIDGQTNDAADFWHGQLSDVAPALLPQMHRQKTDQVHRHERTVSIDLQHLKLFCKKIGITLQALGQTCWSLVLAHRTCSLTAVYGVVLSGRDTEDSQRVMMPIMNTIAFATVILGSTREMLQATQETISSVRQYQNYPLAKAIASSAKNGILFNTLFTYQVNPADTSADSGKTPLYESVDSKSNVEYPVCVEMEATGSALMLRIASSAAYLNLKETITVLDDMNSVFEYITKTPEQDLITICGNRLQLCGLPPFTLRSAASREDKIPPNQDDVVEVSHSDAYMAIREVLSSVSATPETHIHSNSSLYHIGLDSISAIKTSALLRRKGVHLSVTGMLRAATLGEMARAVEDKKTQRNSVHLQNDNGSITPSNVDLMSTILSPASHTEQLFHNIDTRMIEAIYPASSGQIYMLAVWASTNGALFHPVFRYKLSKSYQRDAIERGWEKLITQLPLLRTAFIMTNEPTLPVAQCLLREAPVAARKLHLGEGFENQEIQPLVRLSVEVGKDDWIITLRIHHALYDAISISSMRARLEANIVQDGTELLDEQTQSSPQVLFNQLAVVRSTDKARQFWSKYLSPDHNFHRLHQGIEADAAHLQRYTSAWIPDVSRTRATVREQGVGIQAFFFAAYARVYLALSQRQHNKDNVSMTRSRDGDVVIGIYLANRGSDIEGSSPLVPTVNLLPLRIRISAEISLLQIAKKVQEDLTKIGQAEHSAVGLWQIDEWTGVKIDTFINFLSLPANIEDGNSSDSQGVNEILRNAPRDELEVAATTNLSRFMQDIRSSAFATSYPLSLDIEVALRNGGLDLGIFGWTSMIDTQDMTWLEDSLRRVFLDGHA